MPLTNYTICNFFWDLW